VRPLWFCLILLGRVHDRYSPHWKKDYPGSGVTKEHITGGIIEVILTQSTWTRDGVGIIPEE
jgi:hypothetical protein